MRWFGTALAAMALAGSTSLSAERNDVDGAIRVVDAEAADYDFRVKLAGDYDAFHDEVWAIIVCEEADFEEVLRVYIVEQYDPIYDLKVKVADSLDQRLDRKVCLLP